MSTDEREDLLKNIFATDDPSERKNLIHQYNSTLPTFPQVISVGGTRIANDGAGRCSPVVFDRDMAPTDYLDRAARVGPLASVLQQVVQQHILPQMNATNPAEWHNGMFDPYLEQCDTALSEVLGEAPRRWSAEQGMPFRLDLVDKLSALLQDEDHTIVEEMRRGVNAHCTPGDTTVPPIVLWPLKESLGEDKFTPRESDEQGEIWQDNYSSLEDADEFLLEMIRADFNKQLQKQFIEKSTVEEISLMGVMGCIVERLDSDGKPCKIRLIWDGSKIGPNWACQQAMSQEFPGPEELIEAIRYVKTKQGKDVDLGLFKFDIATAFKLVPLRLGDRRFFGFVLKDCNGDTEFWRWRVAPFGWALSGLYWSRWASKLWRLAKLVLCNLFPLFTGLIFVDDGLLKAPWDELPLMSGVLLLLLRLFGAPMSWKKSALERALPWVGYRFHPNENAVGLPDEKMIALLNDLIPMLEMKRKWPFRRFRKFVHRLSWWSRVCPFLKTFLRTAFAEITRVERFIEGKARREGWSTARQNKYQDNAFVFRYKFEREIPVWIEILHTHRMIVFPLLDSDVQPYRTDASAVANSACVAGWGGNDGCHADVVLQESTWFEYVIDADVASLLFPNMNVTDLTKFIGPIELLGQLLGLVYIGPRDNTARFHPGTDSQVSQYAINKWRTKSPAMLRILLAVSWQALKRGYWPCPEYWAGVDNDIADALSRVYRQKEKQWVRSVMTESNKKRVTKADVLNLLQMPTLVDVQDALRALQEEWRRENNDCGM